MHLDTIREYCLKKPGKITEGFPFGEGALVYKVNGKMFLLVMVDEKPLSMNLKSDPERAIEWRERYEAVQPGYHTCLRQAGEQETLEYRYAGWDYFPKRDFQHDRPFVRTGREWPPEESTGQDRTCSEQVNNQSMKKEDRQ